jgi:hypothetical protein
MKIRGSRCLFRYMGRHSCFGFKPKAYKGCFWPIQRIVVFVKVINLCYHVDMRAEGAAGTAGTLRICMPAHSLHCSHRAQGHNWHRGGGCAAGWLPPSHYLKLGPAVRPLPSTRKPLVVSPYLLEGACFLRSLWFRRNSRRACHMPCI